MSLAEGTHFAKFTVDRTLGQGGFGITYLAFDNSGGEVALKEYFPARFARRAARNIVAPEPGHRDEFLLGRKAFYDEAFRLKELPSQRGLVRVRSAFERHNTVYCAMEFVDGRSLAQLLQSYHQRGLTIDESLIVSFLADIATALCAVHEADILHRDIKPGNIIIRRSSHEPVLIDFGAARRMADAAETLSMLSQQYAPIEFYPDLRAVSSGALREGPRSDVFSLSVTLYEMMTGQCPPPARARLATAQATGEDPYVPVAEALARGGRAGDYGAWLTALVDRGCALRPNDRPEPAELVARLRQRGAKLPAEPGRPAAPEATATPWSKPRKHLDGEPSDQTGSRAKVYATLLIILILAFLTLVFARYGS